MSEVIQVVRTENPDSLEIGSSKEGKIKVYGNADNKEAFQKKIKVMLELRDYANGVKDGSCS